jgi:hypothetical protein
MDLFLKIVGVLALVVAVGVVGFGLFLWWGWRQMVRNIAPTPSTIDLLPDAEAKWLKTEAVQHDLAACEALGYACGPAYTVEGIAGVGLVGLTHPESGASVVLYTHPVAGNWADLCLYFTDGFELTVTSAPMGEQMDSRPNTEKIYRKGAPLAELHALLVERGAGRGEVDRFTPENFRERYIADYARTMAWRNAKDGTSEEEFMRVAAGHKRDLTPEQLREAFMETKLGELRTRSEEALETFEKSTTLSVAEWKKYEHLMIVYRANLHPEAYLNYLRMHVDVPEAEVARYRDALGGGLSLKGLMERMAADTRYGFVRLGEVKEPAPFEIYGLTLPPA